MFDFFRSLFNDIKSILCSASPYNRGRALFDATKLPVPPRRLRVLMAAGHGYGNLGDEAQLGACVSRWRKGVEGVHITVFTPNPDYTGQLHDADDYEWAPRVAWFRSNTMGPYDDSLRFRIFYAQLRLRVLLTARAVRRGIPLSFCNRYEFRILQLIADSDILHISGGGFLTGMTRSRLWETCLIMEACHALEKPYMLTGQTIGVFRGRGDARIARRGLRHARYIGLRDAGISEEELSRLGIRGKRVESACDDALFCPRIDPGEARLRLQGLGVNVAKPYSVVNFHYWGQVEEERQDALARFGEMCRSLLARGMQVVMLAMTPSDLPALECLGALLGNAFLSDYDADYRVARGIIGDSCFVLTMKHHPLIFAQGEGVPVLAVALDDYYTHKNAGALRNTGQEAFLLDRESFYSPVAFSVLEKAIVFKPEAGALERFRKSRAPYRWPSVSSRPKF